MGTFPAALPLVRELRSSDPEKKDEATEDEGSEAETEMEKVQEDAAHEREDEGGYQ